MVKTDKGKKKGPDFIALFQRKLMNIKNSSSPYLVPKYWIIYAAAFGLGFYLWGPTHGLVEIKKIKLFQPDKTSRIAMIETLQQEIEQLKKEINIQKLREQEKFAEFSPDNFSRPAFGDIIQGFEWVNINNTWRLHAGIDIRTATGSSIMASAEGTVIEVSEVPGEGLKVTLEHGNGWESIYANLSEVTVKKGDKIIKGTILGLSGIKCCNSEKPGFHFGIFHNRQPVNPEKIIEGF